MPEAVIIGAGPAGSIASLILARAGWNITIVEQHRFPRNKVCGECLSALGISVLNRMDLCNQFDKIDPAILNRVYLHPSNGNSFQIELPKPMWGISRNSLDRCLLDQAVRAGSRLVQPWRYEGIDGSDAQSVRLKLRDLQTNDIRVMETPWLIVADGKSVSSGRGRASSSDLGIKSHWSGISGPPDAIELFGCSGAYGGLAPIEDDRWNAAFSVRAEMAKESGGDLQMVFDRLVADNPAMHARFDGARRVGSWLASPLRRFAVRRDWPARTILLGNAAAAIEPIGGEGMGLAMRSAEIAAELMIHSRGVWHPSIAAELQRRFTSLWQVRQLACRAGGLVASSPTLARIASPWLRHNRPITRAVLNWAGK